MVNTVWNMQHPHINRLKDSQAMARDDVVRDKRARQVAPGGHLRAKIQVWLPPR